MKSHKMDDGGAQGGEREWRDNIHRTRQTVSPDVDSSPSAHEGEGIMVPDEDGTMVLKEPFADERQYEWEVEIPPPTEWFLGSNDPNMRYRDVNSLSNDPQWYSSQQLEIQHINYHGQGRYMTPVHDVTIYWQDMLFYKLTGYAHQPMQGRTVICHPLGHHLNVPKLMQYAGVPMDVWKGPQIDEWFRLTQIYNWKVNSTQRSLYHMLFYGLLQINGVKIHEWFHTFPPRQNDWDRDYHDYHCQWEILGISRAQQLHLARDVDFGIYFKMRKGLHSYNFTTDEEFKSPRYTLGINTAHADMDEV